MLGGEALGVVAGHLLDRLGVREDHEGKAQVEGPGDAQHGGGPEYSVERGHVDDCGGWGKSAEKCQGLHTLWSTR